MKGLDLRLEGVAIRSGALKKQEEDRASFMEHQSRFIVPNSKEIVIGKQYMGGGFKVPQKNDNGDNSDNIQDNGNYDQILLNNPLNKRDIMRNLGIDDLDGEYALDWDTIGTSGTAKSRVELADKLLPKLSKDYEKLQFRKNQIYEKLQLLRGETSNQPEQYNDYSQNDYPINGNVEQGSILASSNYISYRNNNYADSIPNYQGDTIRDPVLRSQMANNYGIRPNNIPYGNEVDVLEENFSKYQEIDHWYSSLQAPNEENIEVLRKLNQQRISALRSMYLSKKSELAMIEQMKQMEEGDGIIDQNGIIKRSIRPKSRKERNREKRDYKNRFKNYLHNKDKHKRRQDRSEERLHDFDRFECTSPDPVRVKKEYTISIKEDTRIQQNQSQSNMKQNKENNPSVDKSKSRVSKIKNEDSDEEEEVVVDWIWHKINPNYREYIEKEKLIVFLLTDAEVREVFELTDNQIPHIIESLITERPGYVNFDEFFEFMVANKRALRRGEEEQRIADNMRREQSKKECLLTDEQFNIMKEVFDKIDIHGDLVVERAVLVQKIRDDVRIRKYLDRGVVYVPMVRREIPLRKVLHQIEQEEFLKAEEINTGDSKFVSSKRYISWNQFIEYFTNYSKNKKVSNIDLEFKRDEVDDQNMIEVPKHLLAEMKDIFDRQKNEDDFVKTFEYLDGLKRSNIVQGYFETGVRSEARYGSIPGETLLQVMKRIEDQADDFIDWDELIQYFTKRGQPVKVIAAKTKSTITKTISESHFHSRLSENDNRPSFKQKFETNQETDNVMEKTILFNRKDNIRDPIHETQIRDFVDIEEEEQDKRDLTKFQSAVRVLNEEVNERRSRKDNQENEEDDDEDLYYNSNEEDIEESDYIQYRDQLKKITVPELSGYQERQENRNDVETIAEKKLQNWIKDLKKEEEEALNYKFKAKEVPKAVREPRYDKIIQEQERRREEVKKNSLALTRANEKPFAFYERDKTKEKKFKEDWELKQHKFKANEVPWFCSVELYEQEMQKSEQLRKEKINRRAQEMLAMSKLPPRMEKHEQERKQQQLFGEQRTKMDWDSEMTFQPPKAKPLPNFKKAQDTFQRMLDKKRAYKKPTQIKEFRFSSTSRVPKIDYLEKENEEKRKEKLEEEENRRARSKSRKRVSSSKEQRTFAPSLTKKFVAQMELNRKNKNESLKRQEEKANNLRKKRESEIEAAKRLRATLAIQEANREVHNKKSKDDATKKVTFQNKSDSNSGYNFQSYNKRNEERVEKIKTLLHIYDRHIKHGTKNWKQYFNGEEIEMIEDGKILRGKGLLK